MEKKGPRQQPPALTPLVIDLLRPDRRPPHPFVPHDLALPIETRPFVGHWNHLRAVRALLPADPHLVPRHPQQRRLRGDGGMIVRVSLHHGVVDDVSEAPWDQPAERLVVGINVRAKEFAHKVGFLVRGRRQGIFGVGRAVDGIVGHRGLDAFLRGGGRRSRACWIAVFNTQECFFFRLKRLG